MTRPGNTTADSPSRPRRTRVKVGKKTPSRRRVGQSKVGDDHHEFFAKCFELSDLARRIAARIRPGTALYAVLPDPGWALRAVLAVAFTTDAAACLTQTDLPVSYRKERDVPI